MTRKKLTDKVNDKVVDDKSDEDQSKYYDNYVATPSFNDFTIVAYGKDPAKVMTEAKELGHKKPVIMYVHHPDTTYIYEVA